VLYYRFIVHCLVGLDFVYFPCICSVCCAVAALGVINVWIAS